MDTRILRLLLTNKTSHWMLCQQLYPAWIMRIAADVAPCSAVLLLRCTDLPATPAHQCCPACTQQVTAAAADYPYNPQQPSYNPSSFGGPDSTGKLGEAARSSLSKATQAMSRYGWIGFWVQLTLSVVSGVILLFSVAFTSQVSSPPGRPDLEGGSCNGPRAGICLQEQLLGVQEFVCTSIHQSFNSFL
jgi:hypothetical protein